MTAEKYRRLDQGEPMSPNWWLPGAAVPARRYVKRLRSSDSDETNTKPFPRSSEDAPKRVAIMIGPSPEPRSILGSRSQMIPLKVVGVVLGVGLLLSCFFSTFGTEEAFVLLAAVFA